MRLLLLLFLLVLSGLVSSYTALAQVVAPSQGGEVGLILVTATTMELKFGTSGNGQGRVVAMVATNGGMPVPLAATDNAFYTANAAYSQGSSLGQGYAVYNGPGHSATVTGLTPNTYYYIASAEYNTDGTSIAYNTHGTSISTATRNAFPNVTPLPVELISFTGTLNSRAIATLRWSTASESNTVHFAVERSPDGVGFAEAGRVAAAGNSTQQLIYSLIDPQPLTKLTYYRLKQIDHNGTSHYSPTLTLTPFFGFTHQVDVYPNPGTGSTMQLLLRGYEKESLTLRITDALGQLIATQTFQPLVAEYITLLSLASDLATGTYLLTLTGSGLPVQKRINVTN